MEKFSNLKIELFVENSVSMQKRKGAFDSVLALLYFNDLKNKNQFDGDYSQQLNFLDMTDGVYHTSFPIIKGMKYYDKEQLIKKFDHDMYAKHGEIVAKNGNYRNKVNNAQGTYKNEFYSIERFMCDSVIYYVRGNKEIIERLLRNLQFIGKKSSLGWGKIKHIQIDEIEKDYSIFKDLELMRNIPIKNSWNHSSDKVNLFRLTHPYWSKENLFDCLMPR
jgi:hypothetical protein